MVPAVFLVKLDRYLFVQGQVCRLRVSWNLIQQI